MALQELVQISPWLKMDFWKLNQIDSRLKKLPEYFYSNQLTTQKTFQNFDSNRLMTQKLSGILIRIKSWLNDSNQLLISLTFFGPSLNFVDLFWAYTKFRWPFLGFHSISLTFFGHSTQVPWFESAHDSSSISKTWIDSIHDSSSFPGIGSESTHDSSGFPRYWFRLIRDSKCFHIFYSNQLMTQA